MREINYYGLNEGHTGTSSDGMDIHFETVGSTSLAPNKVVKVKRGRWDGYPNPEINFHERLLLGYDPEWGIPSKFFNYFKALWKKAVSMNIDQLTISYLHFVFMQVKSCFHTENNVYLVNMTEEERLNMIADILDHAKKHTYDVICMEKQWHKDNTSIIIDGQIAPNGVSDGMADLKVRNRIVYYDYENGVNPYRLKKKTSAVNKRVENKKEVV